MSRCLPTNDRMSVGRENHNNQFTYIFKVQFSSSKITRLGKGKGRLILLKLVMYSADKKLPDLLVAFIGPSSRSDAGSAK